MACFILYWPAVRYPLLNYDDPFYVASNPFVKGGITWHGFKYAFASIEGFWHPLTWLSLMVDASISTNRELYPIFKPLTAENKV